MLKLPGLAKMCIEVPTLCDLVSVALRMSALIWPYLLMVLPHMLVVCHC